MTKSNERPDFFGNILKHQNTERGLSFPEMISNASTLIIAGSETTATLLSGVTYLLLRNPRVLAKLQDEIRSTFTKEEEITLESCNKLEYCLAVLTESLRVYPPVPIGLPRIVDAQGDMIAGNWVPGGVSTEPACLQSRTAPLTPFIDHCFRLSTSCQSFLCQFYRCREVHPRASSGRPSLCK